MGLSCVWLLNVFVCRVDETVEEIFPFGESRKVDRAAATFYDRYRNRAPSELPGNSKAVTLPGRDVVTPQA